MKLRQLWLQIPRVYKLLGLVIATALGIIVWQLQLTTPNTTSAQSPVTLNGAGATFPLFLYERWFKEYSQTHSNIQINYQPIGSAAGIRQIVSETIDFGASDIAMTDEEMAKVDREVVLVPMTAGSVVIAYNLPNIDTGLKLSREVYADIFLGNIKRWSNPKIAKLNPELNLPDLPITLIHRSDGSGTTAVLTKHLSAISSEWNNKVGSGLNVAWPAGIGIKSNAGVSAQIKQGKGTIGYVEYSFAQQLGLSTAALENRAGNYIQPSLDTTANALENLTLPDNLRAFVTDPKGENAYPVVTYSWLLAYGSYEESSKAKALQDVILWGLTEGQSYSQELGYVPLSDEVVEKATTAAKTIGSR